MKIRLNENKSSIKILNQIKIRPILCQFKNRLRKKQKNLMKKKKPYLGDF